MGTVGLGMVEDSFIPALRRQNSEFWPRPYLKIEGVERRRKPAVQSWTAWG